MKIFIKKGSYVDPSVEIGRCTRINNISHIGPCKIGSFCAIGGRLVVRSSDHDTSYFNMQDWAQKKIIRSKIEVAGKDKGPVTIGNAVWIGDSVVILPGVKIGDGAVIGAGSVVTHSIPSFSIAAGNPARVIKKRFNDKIIDRIKKINWWDWDDKMIHQRKELFEINLKKTTIENLDLLLKRYNL